MPQAILWRAFGIFGHNRQWTHCMLSVRNLWHHLENMSADGGSFSISSSHLSKRKKKHLSDQLACVISLVWYWITLADSSRNKNSKNHSRKKSKDHQMTPPEEKSQGTIRWFQPGKCPRANRWFQLQKKIKGLLSDSSLRKIMQRSISRHLSQNKKFKEQPDDSSPNKTTTVQPKKISQRTTSDSAFELNYHLVW